jgi:peptide/nickel transport system ATP-binding protein
MTAPPLLAVQALAKHYRLPRERLLSAAPQVQALAGVSFELAAGRSLGVVGESGSGKSTLARLVMALEPPSAGRVLLDGQDLHALPPAGLRAARDKLQMVFQDPYGSLDPRRTIAHTVAEPLRMLHGAPPAGLRAARDKLQMVFQDPYGSLDPRRTIAHTVAEPLRMLHGAPPAEQRERAAEALHEVGLGPESLTKYPHEFSGGQRQRIAIARALITRPKLIVADEPVSALDVSVQAQVLNLLQDLQQRLGLALLFISHDLGVVDRVSDQVIVLYQGRIVEQGAPDVLFHQAAHPYTRALLRSVPRLMPGARRRAVRVPLPLAEASAEGCAFAPRCPWAQPLCLQQQPALRALPADAAAPHAAACHRAETVAAEEPATMPQNG